MTTDPGGDSGLPFLFLALPVMDEPDFLPRLLNCLANQSYKRFKLYVCVNQPETWWSLPDKYAACINNEASIRLLHDFTDFGIVIIDRSSRGCGWTGKQHGVGYARKTLMDEINAAAVKDDIIVSMDADSVFNENYLKSIALNFQNHPHSAALSVPYFHPAPSDAHAARAILRYEIYMRHYFLNLERIGSPFAFTALGSAMALPVWAYRAIGGMTPKLSGEDFYFLQKLRKYGHMLLWNEEVVYPEARFSDRVFFGTGPAMIKGARGDWSSYPVYPGVFFDEIFETYSLLPDLYVQPRETKVIRFISSIFKENDPLQPLRTNHKDLDHFTRGFHEKFDGLRILQYLKTAKETDSATDEQNLWEFLTRFFPSDEVENLKINPESFSFSNSPVEVLERVRLFLFEKEMKVRFTSTPG
ncbi:MAG: glycosyltransferase [Bacteroidetes bacterium]|nr:glycosyltransferase [Bacteroidota bacterium]